MAGRRGIVERAFQLAASGACASMEDLRDHLKAEGYLDIEAQVTGPKIRTQLRALIEQAKRS